MGKIKKFVKNYKYSIPVAVVIIIVLIFAFTRGGKKVTSESITLGRTTLAQEISVTGRVHPAENVDLAVQSGGRVSEIRVAVGQTVTAGETLLRVDSSDLQIRLGRQQAALQKAQLALANQQPGAGNATDDLKKAYEDGFNTIADTFLDIPGVITGVDNMINKSSTYSPYLDQESIRPLGQTALDMRQALVKEYNLVNEQYQALFTKYKSFSRAATPAELEVMLNQTYDVTKLIANTIKSTRNLVDYVENQRTNATADVIADIDADQATLSTYTQNTNTDLSALLTIKNTIKNSRDAINSQTNNTESSSIDIRQAQLDIQDTLVQINNRTIKSPIDGIVTKIDAKVGETLSPTVNAVSVISQGQFEIEANIPEADIAKLQVGQAADVTMDAYGSDVIFKAQVSIIDPAETLIDGVATYKTTFTFIEKDERIKSGMTADIVVKGAQKENVLAIPQRAVIMKNGGKYVQVIQGEKIVEKQVETGFRGSDGRVEIVSGLTEGENVVVFTDQK